MAINRLRHCGEAELFTAQLLPTVWVKGSTKCAFPRLSLRLRSMAPSSFRDASRDITNFRLQQCCLFGLRMKSSNSTQICSCRTCVWRQLAELAAQLDDLRDRAVNAVHLCFADCANRVPSTQHSPAASRRQRKLDFAVINNARRQGSCSCYGLYWLNGQVQALLSRWLIFRYSNAHQTAVESPHLCARSFDSSHRQQSGALQSTGAICITPAR